MDAPDGPLLVLAGPGSGKTLVLTLRVATLVAERGVSPASVLAITFASKTACELHMRLNALLGADAGAIDIATFHSLGLRIVRQWQEALGYGPAPLIVYRASESRALLRDLLVARGEATATLEQAERAIGRARLGAAALTPSQRALLDAYAAAMIRRGAVDFPAMLRLPLRLFREQPRALARYRRAYRHIVCDEFQDVAGVQYALLHGLAAEHRNLALVGDERQAIYGWRGADVQIVQRFLADFPEAQRLHLGQNFRSSGKIVALANALGGGRDGGARLWTTNPDGRGVTWHSAFDAEAEATFVANEVCRLVADDAISLDDIAVLYRVQTQATPLEFALRRRGVPYRVAGHSDLFASREARDLLAYLQLVACPGDPAALARIVNTPPRGLEALASQLRHQPLPLARLEAVAASYGPGARSSARALTALITELRAGLADLYPAEILDRVLERTGYGVWLARQANSAGRLARVEALRACARQCAGGDHPMELAEWLVAVALADDPGAAASGVTLSTIHAAKGAEWRVVFVVGLEEGLLPHAQALREAGGETSEGRVLYVAITRAKERLYLSRCRTRLRNGRPVLVAPSRFLRGLPPRLLQPAA